jgi:uncharacterized protein
MERDMIRSITVALLVALAPLAIVATKQFIEGDTGARRHDQESIRQNLARLAEEREETAQAPTVLETASAIFQKSAAQMKEQGVNQPGHPHEGEFSFWIMEGETGMILSGYIAHGVARKLSEFLAKAPQIRAIGLYSGGGRISEAIKIRDLIRSRNIDTFVYNRCFSACTIAFLGGVNRYIGQEKQMGFHGSRWLEFENNYNHDQYMVDKIISLGINAVSAEKAYRAPNEGMWFPSIAELTRAGFVTEVVDGQFSASILVEHRHTVDPIENTISALGRADYESGIRLLRPLAEQGDALAQFILGFMYGEGKGVPQDHEKAVKWYRLAADQGYAAAQNNLGIRYSNGWGVPKDEAQAVAWFRRAAEQGEFRAQLNLANRYYEGIGVQQNYGEAAKWYRLAAEQGLASAQSHLGYMYSIGLGVPQGYVEAYMWFDLAASRHSAGTEAAEWAVRNRDSLAPQMTPSQIAEAQRLTREWRPKFNW